MQDYASALHPAVVAATHDLAIDGEHGSDGDAPLGQADAGFLHCQIHEIHPRKLINPRTPTAPGCVLCPMKRTHLFVAIMTLVAAACGGAASDSTTTTTASTTTQAPVTTEAPTTTTDEATTTTASSGGGTAVDVFAQDFSFSPSTITIKVGGTVRWNLTDGSHTTTSGTFPTPDGMWNQTLSADSPTEVTFPEAGTFNYFCRFHGDFMSGRVVVEP